MGHRFLVPMGDAFRLDNYDPSHTFFDEPEAERILHRNRDRIAELQNILYAEANRSLLVILQSMDTGGKDPIIRDVLSAANPQACRVTAFKKASKSEKKRAPFWRFYLDSPALGEIGVFNRSYYDEPIGQRAHDEVTSEDLLPVWERTLIFERLLVESGTTVIKIFLHISKQEQKRRLQGRMEDPDRHWELSEADFEERKFWDGYMRAYQEALRRTNVEYAPWYLIPSDRSWFRDAAASVIISSVLEQMDPKFPPAKVDLAKVELVD